MEKSSDWKVEIIVLARGMPEEMKGKIVSEIGRELEGILEKVVNCPVEVNIS